MKSDTRKFVLRKSVPKNRGLSKGFTFDLKTKKKIKYRKAQQVKRKVLGIQI